MTRPTHQSSDEEPATAAVTPVLQRAPRIRREDVGGAADALLLEGNRPTVERVRNRLGRGSPNTIALFLDHWWAQLGARLRDLPGQELPGVPEPVANALLNLWSQAIDHARGLLHDSIAQHSVELDIQRAELEAKSTLLERERMEFVRERIALEQTVDILRRQLSEASERYRTDQDRVQALQEESKRLLKQVEVGQQEARVSAARLQEAHHAHQVEQRVLGERAESNERHWIKQVDEARQALLAEQRRGELLGQQAAQLREEHASLQAECLQLRTQLDQVTHALATVRAENIQMREADRQREAQAAQALKDLQAAHGAAAQQFEILQGQMRDVLTETTKFRLARSPPSRRGSASSSSKPRQR